MNCLRLPKSLLLFFLLCSSFLSYAQERTITGKVIDKETNTPLEGVSVHVKNTNNNAVTDAEGTYSIKVPSTESIVTFSRVGFSLFEIKVGSGSSLDASMAKLNINIDEVVVVGYGNKKKSNLLGSVATIKAEDVVDLPVANLGTALANRVPGVGVSTTSGKPGATTTITIRDPTLFAASGRLGLTQDPLFIIDGLTVTKTDFDNLDASLVESISFLKDASAAIYGASGAKGVVLVTTKRGKPGKAKISYSGYFGNSTASTKPKTLSAYDHAKMLNDGYELANAANNVRFSQADLDYLKTQPYKSWYDELWKPASLMRHTINVSGGTDKVTFFAGGNYYNEGGNFGDIHIIKYGIRSGMDAKISPSVSASISLSTDYSVNNRQTLKGSSTETEDLMIRALFLTPQWVPLTIRGLPNNWAQSPNPPGPWNPTALFNSGDYEKSNSQGLSLNATIDYHPQVLKGFFAKVQFGKLNRAGTSKQYFPSYQVFNFNRSGQNSLLYTDVLTGSPTSTISNTNRLQQGVNYNNSYQLITSAGYAKKIGKHDFDVLVAAEQTEASGDSYLTYRDGQQIPGVDQMFAFNAATTTIQLNGATESGKRSYLGRLSYSYDNKYLLEFVGRYDASANFPPGNRWGLFPALGIGWRISQEDFFRKNISFINSLKFRVNVGLIGDDRIQSYQYKARFTQTTGMLFGGSITNGLDPNIYPNPDITWEKARTLNYGLDATFLNNRMNLSVDIWNRHTYDGFDDLAVATFPYTTGINVGLVNNGIQNAWGTEIVLGYKGNISKDWDYSIDAFFNSSDNMLVQGFYSLGKLGGVTEYSDIMIGKSSKKYTSSNYGYISKGILRTQADVDAVLAKNPNYKIGGQKPQVGFMDFEDINKDGVIDDKDITPMFNNVGTLFNIGFTISASYKTLRLLANVAFAVGGKKFVDAEARKVPTTNQGAPSFWKDHWTPENPDAKYPRADAPLAKENSTFWALPGTTSRVNNMVLSYAMPKRISDKYKIPDCRVFVTGENLWNIINPYKYKDPATGNFATYPTLRTISLGLNVTL
ncbi:MAG: SusC/RagA family TonB-linked outer membrane protein [Chitinophagaceae bacterium]